MPEKLKNRAIDPSLKNEEYNIYNTAAMDKNELYTALSRAKTLSQIHLTYNYKVYLPAKEPEERWIDNLCY